jgi:hypothetical protein
MEFFTSRHRGPDFCPYCGEEVWWARLLSGLWMPVQPYPVLYLPRAGRAHLIDTRFDGSILRDCLIYRGSRGMDTKKLKTGYEQHMYRCCMRSEWTNR